MVLRRGVVVLLRGVVVLHPTCCRLSPRNLSSPTLLRAAGRGGGRCRASGRTTVSHAVACSITKENVVAALLQNEGKREQVNGAAAGGFYKAGRRWNGAATSLDVGGSGARRRWTSEVDSATSLHVGARRVTSLDVWVRARDVPGRRG